jgi:hypothetical protein
MVRGGKSGREAKAEKIQAIHGQTLDSFLFHRVVILA